MGLFSPPIPVFSVVFSFFFAVDEESSWMKKASVGLENANMAVGQNMSDRIEQWGEKSGDIPWGQEM